MGCPFSWKGYVGMWFATLVGCRIDIIKAQATEKRGNDMLHTLEKGEYPKGHRYWSNATGDLNAALEDLPVQLRRVLDELWSDGYGVECYLVEWNGRYCVQLSAMYDESYAADLGMGYPELVELARGRAEELGAERPDLHVVFAEDVDQWKANDPFTEIWVVMPWDVDADAFHEVSDMETSGGTSAVSLPRVGLEERGTPMLDARTARILAEENEKGYEARWRREMVERCEKNIEKAVNEGRLHAVLFVGGLDDAKREALKVMRERGFEIGEEVWREGLFKYQDVYIARW